MQGAIIPISVIIPSYNRHESLVRTVKSLCDGDCVPKEIIIIDQSNITIERKCFDQIFGVSILIEHISVASSTHARNIGIKLSSQDIILFCDDDILVNNETLARLYSAISKSNIALVSAINYSENSYFNNKKNLALRDVGGTILGLKKFWRKDGYIVKSNMRGRYATGIVSPVKTEWAMGYFFCVKKCVLSNMNHFFDEHLIKYAYAEDLDFSYRYCLAAKKMGLQTLVDPCIFVNHLASREWRIPKQIEVNYIFANRRYLSWKLFPSRNHYRVAMCVFDHLYLVSQFRNKEYAKEIKIALDLCKNNKNMIRAGHISELF